MEWMIETERLGLRKITRNDFDDLHRFLSDPEVMYAWEHGFSEEETKGFIEKNLMRYERDGYSYLVAIDKVNAKVIGLIGPLIEEMEDQNQIGVAYIVNKQFWGKGYAKEGVKACINYAFNTLGAREVMAQIRPNNLASLKVAESVGMKQIGEYSKHYNGKDMIHLIYSIKALSESI